MKAAPHEEPHDFQPNPPSSASASEPEAPADEVAQDAVRAAHASHDTEEGALGSSDTRRPIWSGVVNVRVDSLLDPDLQIDILPPRSEEEYQKFRADVQAKSCVMTALVVRQSDSRVLDGKHRLRAARELGYETVPVTLADCKTIEDAVEAAILGNTMNKGREWNTFQLAELGLRLLEIEAARARKRQGAHRRGQDVASTPELGEHGAARDHAARQVGLKSGRLLDTVRRLLELATPRELGELRQGELTITKAAKLHDLERPRGTKPQPVASLTSPAATQGGSSASHRPRSTRKGSEEVQPALQRSPRASMGESQMRRSEPTLIEKLLSDIPSFVASRPTSGTNPELAGDSDAGSPERADDGEGRTDSRDGEARGGHATYGFVLNVVRMLERLEMEFFTPLRISKSDLVPELLVAANDSRLLAEKLKKLHESASAIQQEIPTA